jgi:CheY-like chemotaxis protein
MTHEQRRHVRIAGPFHGVRVGLLDAPVTIYDLSEGGCFVNCLTAPPESGRHLVLKIDLPEEGWICLKAEVRHAKPEFGFAVSFVDVPSDAADRLRRGIQRRQGSTGEAEVDSEPSLSGTQSTALNAALTAETTIGDTAGVLLSADTKQILVADDDGGVLGLVGKALSSYRVRTARGVAEAISVGADASVDLLITDYLMPDGTGAELIRRLRERQPSLKVLIMTGHEAMLNEQGYDWWAKERHLGKPFTVGDLREAVRALIGSP